MLKDNWLLNKLKNSTKPCIGTWITLPCPASLDVICSTGPDFVVIDTEHAPASFETAQMMAVTCESRRVSPVYRVPGAIQSDIVRSLEIGMHAVQVPNITSAEMVRGVVQSSRYRPDGTKGLSPFTRACDYSSDNAAKMVNIANKNTLLIAQVEGQEGIDNLDEILDVKGIDLVFIGLYDLSNYLGITGELNNPKLKDLFSRLVKRISDHGIIVGSISNTSEQLRFLLDSGARYITHSADCQVLSSAYRSVLDLARAQG